MGNRTIITVRWIGKARRVSFHITKLNSVQEKEKEGEEERQVSKGE